MKNKLKKSTATLLVVCLVLSMFTGTALALKFVFEDSIGHWAEDTIQKLSDKGLVAGYPDGLVHPDEIITRSEFVTLIANTLDTETEVASATSVFTDIEGHWSEQDILLLIELEIILTDEYPSNKFEPDKAISRMEMVRMLTRALGIDHHSDDCICSLDFSDTDLLSEEDKMYLCIANKHYIICGYPDGSFKPEDDSTRAEAFEMIDNNEDAKDVIAETDKDKDKDKDKEDDKDKDDNNRPSGGGGSSYVPAPHYTFALPKTSYLGEELNITPKSNSVRSVLWTVDKDGIPTTIDKAFVGDLSATGGTITPKEDGSYTLTATAKNSRGKTVQTTQTVEVYPVLTAEFVLPKTAHTDTAIVVDLKTKNLGDSDVTWTIKKDGTTADIKTAITGEMTNTGGTIQFKEKGIYELTATTKDELGKVVAEKQTITVYPVAEINLTLQEISHTDKTITLKTETKETDGLNLTYFLTHDGKASKIPQYIEGSLTDGSIRFMEKGVYKLTAVVTDKTGRTFDDTTNITVYPVGSAGFYLPSILHTDDTVAVETTFAEIGDNTCTWSLKKDGKDVSLAEFTTGELTTDGGNIRFKEKGNYTLNVSFTDDGNRSYSYEQNIKAYPVPTVTYTQPEYVHTDTEIAIDVTSKDLDGLTLEWLVDNSFGYQDFPTFVDGTLDNKGGNIHFKRAGIYELVARTTDKTGRVFLFEPMEKTEVLPVLDIGFALPQIAYTDTDIDLRTHGHNNTLPMVWTLIKDGQNISVASGIVGELNTLGGDVRFKEHGQYVLTATMTDYLDREFTHSQSIKVMPVVEYTFTMPSTIHYGANFLVEVATANHTENTTMEWSITKNGETAEYTGTLTENGGNISISDTGTFILTSVVTDSLGRTSECSQIITVTNTAPVVENITVTPTRTAKDGKFFADITATATDADGDGFELEWQGRTADDYYSVGSHTIKVRAKDIAGEYSEWFEKIFTITNETPVVTITATPSRTAKDGKFFVDIKTTTTDADGDAFELEWDGKTADGYYGVGTHTIKVRAKDTAQEYSEWFEKTFTITNETPVVTVTATPTRTVKDGKFFVEVKATATDADGDKTTLEWQDKTADGYYSVGTHTIKVRAKDTAGEYSDWVEKTFTITNATPVVTITATPSRTIKDGKFFVDINTTATDADGDAFELEWQGKTADDYYSVGTHTVRVRAKDITGAYSNWATKTFTIANSAPSRPVITRTPNGNSITPGTPVKITANSTDADGDAITYVWDGRPSETMVYGLGKHIVRVKAVDSTGAESPSAAIVFFVMDSNGSGGMLLTGPNSTIDEDGIDGATITSYTFTVPPVSGHYGDDHGRVKGYNVLTKQWDQLSYGTTVNGITFTKNLTAGLYSQLEFYYYTNHDCMYRKSNITYTVSYHFE